MRVLVACEHSQRVCAAFRDRGHDAWSCDILPASGKYPMYHYQCDIFEILQDFPGDMLIGFPPCTDVAVSGARHFKKKRADGRQADAINFFKRLWKSDFKRICLENPVGVINSEMPPTQIIHPYYFGDEVSKKTCLWLKGLPKLFWNGSPNLFNDPVTVVGKGEHIIMKESGKKMSKWYSDNKRNGMRSITFPGIAEAMAEQWGSL